MTIAQTNPMRKERSVRRLGDLGTISSSSTAARIGTPSTGYFSCGMLGLLLCLLMPTGIWAQSKAIRDSALRHMAAGRYEVAARWLDSSVRGCDTCRQARILLAECLIQLRRDLPRAVELLSPLPATPKTLALQARAHQLSYQFAEAKALYERYLPLAQREVLTDAVARERIAECQNALQLGESTMTPTLLSTLQVRWDSIPAATKGITRGYSIIEIPQSLMPSALRRTGEPTPLMGYPLSTPVGTRLVYTSRRTALGNTDIYLTHRVDETLWSRPVPLSSVVNSPYDEQLPLLSADGCTLYFSSQGHYGMGGFDIFVSRLDTVTQQWSAPENLGFPFNSPYDEFILSPPLGTDTLVLASTRNAPVGYVNIYTLLSDRHAVGKRIASAAELERAARFETVGSTPEAPPKAAAPQKRTVPTATKPFRPVDSDPEYQRELAKGFAQQKKADTLRVQLEKLREQLWNVKTVEQRKRVEARIVPIETEMLNAQRKADIHFAAANLVEQEYITGKRAVPAESAGQSAYSTDAPTHLYQAKPAKSIFQPDEIRTLAADADRLFTFMQEAKTIVRREGSGKGNKKVRVVEELSCIFTKRFQQAVQSTQNIYSNCLAVALMKSNRNAAVQLQVAEARAREAMRNAQAIRNNADSTAPCRSQFDALLLDALANRYFELGFAYTWGMDTFRTSVERRIVDLEILLQNSRPSLSMGNDGQELNTASVEPSDEQDSTVSEASKTPTETPIETPDPTPINPPKAPADSDPILFGASLGQGLTIKNPSPYTTGTPLPKDIPLPKGVVYKLQLGAYSNPVDPALFNGLFPVTAETLKNGKVTKYYAGEFYRYSEAEAGKPIAKKCGFPDAFVVAWYNGRNVPLARAQSLEGNTKASAKEHNTPDKEVPHYVAIGQFPAPLPEYVAKTLALLAPQKEIKRTPGQNSQWNYSVGPYPNKAQAQRLCDNLLACGLTEAKVTQEE